MGIAIRWASLALLFLLAPSASPVEVRCLESALRDELGGSLGYGQEIDFHAYQGARRILFLADGDGDTFGYRSQALNIGGAFSLAHRVAERFPNARVVQGDFNIAGTHVRGNLTSTHVDNSKPLPFADSSFDLVLMRKGLCLCYRGLPCGGFCPDVEDSRRFFGEVIRVLDRRNPKARALLHGQEGWKPKVVRKWTEAAQALERETGTVFTFRYARPGWVFRTNRIDAVPEFDAYSVDSPQILGDFNSIEIRFRPMSHGEAP